MTAVISGTNGLLQSYDYQTPTTGFSYTFTPSSTGTVLVMNPAGTLATGTITMPASPVDGMTITFSSSQQITALTMAGNGASINNPVTLLPAKTAVAYVYRATGTTWWPVQSVPGTGSQLVSGTSQASTSGTSIDFTGIPSWVKRITVMFSGVSVSGGNSTLVQLGSGSVQSTGYVSYPIYLNAGALSNVAGSTSGIVVAQGNATNAFSGSILFSLVGSNSWAASGALSSGTTTSIVASGGVTLSGALDRVRIATTSTDTFDAGSINILYE